LRDVRVKNQIKTKEPIKLYIQGENNELFKAIEDVLKKQVNIEQISFVTEPVGQTITTVIGKDKFYIETEHPVDNSAQKAELLKDLDYYKKFLESVNKKLSNERFVQSAKPEVVQLEQKKKLDAEDKIRAIEDSLKNL
jgi:valyl-tRNA synthetase